MLKGYKGRLISSVAPTSSTTQASGMWSLDEQLQGVYANTWPMFIGRPASGSVSISPPYNGTTFWDFTTQGPLNITSGSYTITPVSTFTALIKMWGEGGRAGIYSGGGGGALQGSVTFNQGQPYYITFGGAGVGGQAVALGTGGNYSGLFLGSAPNHANTIAIAAGGGAGGYDDGGRGATGGAGGHPAGQQSSGYTPVDTRAGGGTQSAGGAAGGGSNDTGASSAGSALQGGNGGSGGGYRGGGGGGGYYGGGGGGMQFAWAGAGGGGGSNFANPSLMTSVTQYSGSGTTPGNSSDVDRNSAGVGGSGSNGAAGGPGRIYINSVSALPVLFMTGSSSITWNFSDQGPLYIDNGFEYNMVPSRTFTVEFHLWGQGSLGSLGGYTTGRITFLQGVTYVVSSGVRGRGVSIGGTQAGHYTGLFLNSITHANSLAIAGGAGEGYPGNGYGGIGGGLTGGNGISNPERPAGGGTQSAGGIFGLTFGEGSGATSGSALQGGNAGNSSGSGPGGDWTAGGAGGGGYYGGGGGNGGGSYAGGGGGGSGYTHPTLITTGSTTQGGGRASPYRGTGGDRASGRAVFVLVL